MRFDYYLIFFDIGILFTCQYLYINISDVNTIVCTPKCVQSSSRETLTAAALILTLSRAKLPSLTNGRDHWSNQCRCLHLVCRPRAMRPGTMRHVYEHSI